MRRTATVLLEDPYRVQTPTAKSKTTCQINQTRVNTCQILSLIDAKLQTQVSEHVRTVVLEFEVTGHIFLVEEVIVDFDFGKSAEFVRKEQTRRWNVHKFGDLKH